jgi:multidrug efflux pump subunit AcrA (membrane-fusion protein)
MSPVANFHAAAPFGQLVGVGAATVERPHLAKRSHVVRLDIGRSPQRRKWSRFGRFVALPLVALAAVALLQPWNKFRSQPVGLTSEFASAVRTVKVERPSRATTASVVLPATIRPWQTTMLHARISGYLTAWHADLGTRVHAGDVLADIETHELDQELAEGTALASEALAAAVQAKAERHEAEAELKVTEAQLARARAEADLARSQLARREKLLVNRTITQEEYDIFKKEVDARAADLAAATSDVVRRRANQQTRLAIVNAREATAKSRQSNVDRLNELQRFKRIVAPFDGVVTRRAAETGMLVSAGKESLFVIEDMSRVRVQINVPQTYSTQTAPGVPALVSVPESTAQPFAGVITRVAQSVDSTNRTMLAEIELENISNRFQPGSYAQVALSVPQDSASWTIPTNTVQMRVEGPHVAIVNDHDQVELKRVSLGRDMGSRVVAGDIRGDERLIVNPGDDLFTGMRVEVGGRELAPSIAQR